MRITRVLTTLLLLLAVTSWSSAQAQQATGSLTGVVTDGASGRPLSAAQVFIEGTGLGGLTNAAGRYVIANVPAGQHTLRVERIGYTAGVQQVTVTAGQATARDFALQEEALALDEIVVTGTAGQARRREVGNTISQVKLEEVPEPVADVGALLQGRVSGAFITYGSGNAGSGADIRLRGNSSASLSNQPLVYIDGVRANSEPVNGNNYWGASADVYNPLSDLNPDDIERVEIVKGPAATTLYGTEAAAGVIQIFTRRGGQGAPQWTAEISQGYSYFRPFGTPEVPYMWLDQVFRRGQRQRYSMSVQGGGSQVGYFVSGSWDDNLDPVYTGAEEKLAVRANTTFRPHEDIMIQFNSSLTKTDLSQVQTGNSVTSIMMSAIRGPQNYMSGRRDKETLSRLLEKDHDRAILRAVNGLTFNYTPGSDFTHRLTLGYDYSNEDAIVIGPYGYLTPIGILSDFSDYIAKGQIERGYGVTGVFSVDYVGTLGLNLGDNLRSTLSFGLQGVQTEHENAVNVGRNFPGPGEWTLTSAAIRNTMRQNKLRYVTGGFFGQNMFALSDKYFLTLGVRVDGNSSFGENLGLQAYPKASASYVISDEAWWPEMLGQMKLRGAYGWAGRAPGAFDKIRTWNAQTFGDAAQAFYPSNLGNADLGPERSSEIEFGADASWLDGRLTAEFTYYKKTTTDALFNLSRPESEGNWNAQLENVGKLENKGVEILTNATVFNTRDFRWDLGLGLSTNFSKVLDLGGAAPFYTGSGNGWIFKGEPVPVVYGFRVRDWFEQAKPVYLDNLYPDRQKYGPNQPTHHWTAQTSLGLPGGIQLSARGELMKGFWVSNYWEGGSMNRNIPHPRCYDAFRKADPTWTPGTLGSSKSPPRPATPPAGMLAWEFANCFGQRSFDDSSLPADYGELRDVTLSVPVSTLIPALTRGWANRVDLTISGRNLATWRNKYMLTGHPEMHQNTYGINSSGLYTRDITRRMAEQLPPQSYFTIAVRAVF